MVACATKWFGGVPKDDGSIPGKWCEILICSYLRHFINFKLAHVNDIKTKYVKLYKVMATVIPFIL